MEANNVTMENESLSAYYKLIFTDFADPRTSAWFLMSNPIPWITIVALYLYFVKVLGPRYMKDKKPYKLTRVMRIYNLFQVAVNMWLFHEAWNSWKNYNWICEPVNFTNDPDALRMAWACYIYHLNKMVDLADTVFFVLRKKDKQITFLHVFHHSLMVMASWILTKYFAGGHATFVGLLNTFVHVLLYSYYYLAAFGPKVQKYLWWKKYLTKIQLIQFCLIFIHNMQLLVTSCEYPRWTVLLTSPNAIFFYYLFADFYKKEYVKSDLKEHNNNAKNGTSTKVKAK